MRRPVGAFQQRVTRRAERVGPIAVAEQHAVVLHGDNARRQSERELVHHHRFGQERFDLAVLQGWQGVGAWPLRAHARGELDRRDAARIGVRAQLPASADLEKGPTILAFQMQCLSREDEVRVANLLVVHAPQFGPTPRALEVHARDAPQRIALLDHVAVRCVRREFFQRNPGLRDLTRRLCLGRRDREILGVGQSGRKAGEGRRQHSPG